MPSVQQAIQQAAKERKLLEITYRKLNAEVSTRRIEVYSIKNNRLFAYDVDAGDHIRQFILSGILKAEVLDEAYTPQWPIEIR